MFEAASLFEAHPRAPTIKIILIDRRNSFDFGGGITGSKFIRKVFMAGG